MTGFPTPLWFPIVAVVAIPLAFVLKRWYRRDAQRSLFALCLLLAFVSPWLAIAAFVAVRFANFLLQRGPRTQSN